MAAPAQPRRSAAERREEILAIAVRHFAEGGFNGTSTEDIAREAGISQPYLFRLFHTKRALFLACSDRACDHLAAVFRRAAEAAPAGERLDAMGHAYVEELLPERHEIRLMLQSYAASADPAIQAHVRARFGELVRLVAELAEVPVAETFDFFSHGMLLNVIAALDLESATAGEPWIAEWAKVRDPACEE
jgi:AcrR family transcriptional regulator